MQGCWILWADKDELRRLRELLAKSHPGKNRHASNLKEPKREPGKDCSQARLGYEPRVTEKLALFTMEVSCLPLPPTAEVVELDGSRGDVLCGH